MNELIELLFFFIIFIGWICSLYGYGQFFASRIPGSMPITRYQVWYYCIFGLIIVGSLAIIINLLTPISQVIASILCIPGLLRFIFLMGQNQFSKKNLFWYGFVAIVIFFQTLYNGVLIYDVGLYHLPAIRWIIENATPCGLANLHVRFGYNGIWFPLSAVIDQGVIQFNRPFFFLNSILLFYYATIISDILKTSLINISKENRKSLFQKCVFSLRYSSASEWFLLLTILPVMYASHTFYLSGPSPDYPIFLITLVLIAFIIEFIEENISLSDFCTWALLLLGIFACAIKLSAIILLPITFFTVIIPILRVTSNNNLYFEPSIAWLQKEIRTVPIFFSLLVFLLWIPLGIRGFILSGNPIFPISIGSFVNVPWSVPREVSRADADTVTAWARLPGPHYRDSLGNFSWIDDWLIQFFITQKLLIISTIGACIIAVCIWVYSSRQGWIYEKTPPLIPTWYPFLVIITGLVFWFITAPDPRFGLGFLSALPIFLVVYPLLRIKKPYPYHIRLWIFGITAGMLFIAGIMGAAFQCDNIHEHNTLPAFPDVSYKVKETHNGEPVYVPIEGDQVWNLPLPNAPSLNPDLTIIRDSNTGHYLMFLPPRNPP